MTDTDEGFATAVRTRRIVQGISQAALAKAVSREIGRTLTQQAMAQIESAARRVSIGEAKAIADCLETDIDYLLHGELSGRESVATLARALDAIVALADSDDTRRAIWSTLGVGIRLQHIDHEAWLSPEERSALGYDR